MTTRITRPATAILAISLVVLAAGCQSAMADADQLPAAADLMFGPYVSAVAPDAASVHWVSPTGVNGACRMLGADAGAKVELKSAAVPGHDAVRHTARITDLAPGVLHRYIVTSGGDQAEGAFRTPPARGTAEPFTFASTGDTQSYPLRIRSVAEAIARDNPAFVVHTGDLCNNTRDWTLLEEQFFGPWRDLLRQTAVWPARGNHEFATEPFATLFDLSPTEPWHSFNYGPMHVVILDQWSIENNEKMEPDRMAAMASWLDRDLAGAQGRGDWILVAGHQPMFNVAGHGSTWGHETILPLLYKYGVDAVIGGHSHLWERFVPIGPKGAKPIQFLVSGGGGGPNYPAAPSPILVKSIPTPHYCQWHVDGDRLVLTVKNSGGTVLDQVVFTHAASPNVAAAAIDPDDAMHLLKVYKGLQADVTAHPVGGKAMTFTLETNRFPAGSKVSVETDPGSAWAIKPATFEVLAVGEDETPPPAPLVLVPPADVLLGPGRSFNPLPTVDITLTYHGRTWFTPSVPIGLTDDAARRLTPTIEVVKVPAAAADSITIDGDLSEWQGVPWLHLASTDGASRHLKLAWTSAGLFGAVVAEQQGVHVNAARPWNADSLEVDLERDAQRRMRMTSRGVPLKFFLWPDVTAAADGGDVLHRRMAGRWHGRVVKAVWRKTPTGYTMEFRMSSGALGEAPLAAGRRIGLDLVLRHDGETVERFADTRPFYSTWSTPAYWGLVELAPR